MNFKRNVSKNCITDCQGRSGFIKRILVIMNAGCVELMFIIGNNNSKLIKIKGFNRIKLVKLTSIQCVHCPEGALSTQTWAGRWCRSMLYRYRHFLDAEFLCGAFGSGSAASRPLNQPRESVTFSPNKHRQSYCFSNTSGFQVQTLRV